MNTTTHTFPQAKRSSQVTALSLAFLLTATMLFSINTLATMDATPLQMAQATTTQA